MRVLSIDLDYIMGPVIELYNGLMFNENPTIRWEQFFNKTDFNESHFRIDQSNLLFCYNTFLKALRNCDSVSFGYEHDSILFSIADHENIDLINIDHHMMFLVVIILERCLMNMHIRQSFMKSWNTTEFMKETGVPG